MKRIFSYFIVVIISTVITIGGGWSVKLAVENGSNWEYISASFLNDNIPPTIVEASSNMGQVGGVSTEDCLVNPNYSFNPDSSIVDFLYIRGEDFSFNQRLELAKIYGIDNYTGSSEQNLLLIDKLKANSAICK